MSVAILVVLAVALAALVVVVRPLLGPDTEVEPASASLGTARELQSERDMLLASLKDLEDDRATDKIDEADYAKLEAQLSARAVDVLQRLDRLEAEREAQARRPLAPTLRHPGARQPDS